jgi:hypothetical protein
MGNRDIVAIGTERAALARKLYNQAKTTGHRLLAENWAAKLRDFEGELWTSFAVRRAGWIASPHRRNLRESAPPSSTPPHFTAHA